MTTTAKKTAPALISPVIPGLSQQGRQALKVFRTALADLSNKVEEAAHAWVQIPDEDRQVIIENSGGNINQLAHRFEMIAAGQMHPLLFSAYSANVTKVAKLPLPVQSQLLRGKVPVLVDDTMVEKSVLDMSHDEFERAIRLKRKGSSVTVDFPSLRQQKNYAERKEVERIQEEKKAARRLKTYKEETKLYTLEKGRVRFHKEWLDLDELEQAIRAIRRLKK